MALLPLANRAFGSWLAPTRSRGWQVELRGAAIIMAGYFLAVVAFLAVT